MQALTGTLIVACCSTSSKPCDDFNEFLPLPETMLELVLLWLIRSAHLASNCIAPSSLGEFDLAALRVVGLRQAVISGNFSDGSFQYLH